jgi:dCMP deaminase
MKSKANSAECWAALNQVFIPYLDVEDNVVLDWDDYFSVVAMAVAMRSKDPNLRVGAVVVSEDQVILSTGYNWLPRGIKELPERFVEQTEKYKWITHAETNAIFNASRTGISLVGGTVYTTTFPCSLCAQAIVQAGIRRVFTHGKFWKKDPTGYERGLEVFAEAKISVDTPKMRQVDHKLRLDHWGMKPVANEQQGARSRSSRNGSGARSAANRKAKKPTPRSGVPKKRPA